MVYAVLKDAADLKIQGNCLIFVAYIVLEILQIKCFCSSENCDFQLIRTKVFWFWAAMVIFSCTGHHLPSTGTRLY